ncbi:MAG: hypothetical protein H6739_41255 [Alphaproteobacteria bacterium]|nr:hypothetical protein [Alphaproteobacteria bacterium]
MGTDAPLPAPRMRFECPERWASLRGDGCSRFCDRCQLEVVDLSALDDDVVRDLHQRPAAERPACVRFLQAPDGTLITRTTRRKQLLDVLRGYVKR